MAKDSYDDLGVSASKSGLHEVLSSAGLEHSDGYFAQLSADVAGDDSFVSVLHCDGAGTKSIVPYLYFRETGDRSLFAGLSQDALVMNLDDIYCVGEPVHLLLANTIGRNTSHIDDAAIGEIISSYKRLVEMLQGHGIPIQMSGGETADCGDITRTLLVDAVVMARIARESLIQADSIKPGDVIVGLSSTGQATYEPEPNSGIGSNGLTLARHCLLKNEYRTTYPEVCDPQLAKDVAYRGAFGVCDTPDGLGMSVGKALASPTRTYAPVLRDIFRKSASAISGVVHLTGGAQTKMLRFGKGNHYVKDSLFPTPPLFSLIQETADVPWRDMYKVFNMGHRMELYVDEDAVSSVVETAGGYNIDARVVGRVEAGEGEENSLSLSSEHGSFSYTLDTI